MERFWSKVKVGGPNDCWEWQAFKDEDGYGHIWFQGYYPGAHRVAWILANGDIPKGCHVCHSCDNPGCVNPAHLFIGTPKDNVQDCIRKNRRSRKRHPYNGGVGNGRSKITEDDVIDIRRRCSEGERQADIAKKYGIGISSVSHIVTRRTWKNI